MDARKRIAEQAKNTLELLATQLETTVRTLKAPGRKLEVYELRQLCYLCLKDSYPKLTATWVGRMLRRDHTSIITMAKRATKRLENDEAFKTRYEKLKEWLQSK